jgi:hypothetical protein
MTRFNLMLLASMRLIPCTVVESSAQDGFQDMERFCSQRPTHPACSVIMNEICTQTPSDPACMSDEDDDDSES